MYNIIQCKLRLGSEKVIIIITSAMPHPPNAKYSIIVNT